MYMTILVKTFILYFFIVIVYRLMGKKEIGELSIIDLIVTILIAELAAISIEQVDSSIFVSILPIAVLVVIQIFLSYLSLKSEKIRNFIDGKPSVIIKAGKVNFSLMTKIRYSLDDLLLSLRQKEIRNIEEVEYAFLEPNGKLSIFKYNFFKLKSDYPMPLIVDGSIQKKALKYIRKTSSWLEQELKSKKLDVKDVFYAFYKKDKIFLVKKSETLK